MAKEIWNYIAHHKLYNGSKSKLKNNSKDIFYSSSIGKIKCFDLSSEPKKANEYIICNEFQDLI